MGLAGRQTHGRAERLEIAMTTTIWKVSRASPGVEAAGNALRSAGIGMVEMDWDQGTRALRSGEAALVVADGGALSALTGAKDESMALPKDVMRSLSHDLRTPLSAMAGWLPLIETGKLDEAGLKRALGKLRGNIDDQVKTIDRYLGTT